MLLGSFLFFGIGKASAATVYVSNSATNGYCGTGCSDSNTYAQAQNKATAYATLTKAVSSSVTAGDTIVINDGTYNEVNYVSVSRAGLTITNDPVTGQPGGVIIRAAAGTTRTMHFLQNGNTTADYTIGPIVIDANNAQGACITTDSSNDVHGMIFNGTRFLNPKGTFLTTYSHLKNLTMSGDWAASSNTNLAMGGFGIDAPTSPGNYNISYGTVTITGTGAVTDSAFQMLSSNAGQTVSLSHITVNITAGTGGGTLIGINITGTASPTVNADNITYNINSNGYVNALAGIYSVGYSPTISTTNSIYNLTGNGATIYGEYIMSGTSSLTITNNQYTYGGNSATMYGMYDNGFQRPVSIAGNTYTFTGNSSSMKAVYGNNLASININGGTYLYSGTGNLVSAAEIYEGAGTTSSCVIHGLTGDIGQAYGNLGDYLIMVGSDADPGANANHITTPQIYGNNLSSSNHGILAGYVTGASVYDNIINNTIIGVISKYSTNNSYYDNIILNTTTGGGLRSKGGTGATFYNNTVTLGSGGVGELVTDSSTGNVFKNNIIYTTQSSFQFANVLSGSSILTNNGYYSTQTLPFNAWQSGASYWNTFPGWQGAGFDANPSFFADPQFVSSSNFHLQPTSPAINAGTNVGLTTDFAGNPVPSGPLPDIGAYEFQDSTAPTTTASPAHGLFNSTQSVTLTCNDGPGVGCDKTYYTTDGTNPTTSSTQYSGAISISSTTTLKFFSRDKNLNAESIKSETYTIDTTPPALNITSPTSGNYINGNAAIAFTDDDPHSPLCSPDNSHWTACVSSTTKLTDLTGWSSVAEGDFTLYVKDTDPAGNTGTASVSLTKDTTAATLSFTDSVATGPVQSDTITASWGDATVKKWDYNGNTNCPASASSYSKTDSDSITQTTETNNGKYICLYGEDVAGNKTTLASAHPINIDITPPTLSFTNDVEAGPVQSDTITASWGDATVKKWDYNSNTICSTSSSDYTKSDADSMNQNTQTNNGKYTCLYAEDAVGNKTTLASANPINIDVTPPVGESFTINSGTTLTNSTSVTLNITCPTDTWTPVQMAYGNSSSPTNWTNCATSQVHTLTSGDGSKTVYVRFKDGGGNTTGDLTQNITLDTIAPAVAITAPTTGTKTNGAATITFTDDDPHSPLCSPDNSHWTGCTSSTTKIQDLTGWNGLPEGAFTLYLKDTDSANNTGTTSVTLVKDTTAPSITITDSDTSPSHSKTITASATESAALAYAVNAPGVSTCDGSLTFTSYASITFSSESDNGKTVCYKAQDAAGNTAYSSSNAISGIDTTAPTTTANHLSGTYGGSFNVTLTCSDTGSGCANIYYTTDGSDPTISSTRTQTTAPATVNISTSTTLKYYSIDLVGNAEQVKTQTYTIDATYPMTTINTYPASPTNSQSASFTFSANKSGSTFQCQLDGSSSSSCTSPHNYSNLTPGSHTFSVKATDSLGQVEQTPPTYTWTIDLTPPRISNITSILPSGKQKAGDTIDIDLTFSELVTSSGNINVTLDTGGSCTFSVSNSATGSCNYIVGGSDNSSHLTVTGVSGTITDQAGNAMVDFTPVTNLAANRTMVVDTFPPITTADPDTGTYGTAQDVMLTCDDNGGSGCNKIYYTTDGSDPTTSLNGYSSPVSVSIAANTTLKFLATDMVGNAESIESETYTIDLTNPSTNIIGKPASIAKSASASFIFSANKSGSTYECKLDDDSFSTCTSPQSYTLLTDGPHEFAVRATDTLGHLEPTPPTYDWTVDTTPPSIDSYSPIASYTSNASPHFSFHTTEGGSITYTNCPVNNLATAASGDNIITFPSLSEGTYANCQFKISDSAGNDSDTLTIPTFTVDTTPPNLTNITPTSQTLPATSTSTSLALNTSEPATCKYSTTPDTAYADMTHTFDSTNVTSQSAFISGLTPGQAYTYYVRCSDRAGNVTTTDDIFTFSVASAPANVTLASVKITVGRAVNKFKDAIHIATSKFKLKSRDPNLANGTVKIYKGNSLWKTVTVDASGAWSKTLSLANDASKTIKLQFYDALGNLLGSKHAKVNVDTEAPKFTKFISANYVVARGDKVYWEAKDNDKVEKYKVYFNGHIATVKSARYTVPGVTLPGIYTIKVRAYDPVGNSASKSVTIVVR